MPSSRMVCSQMSIFTFQQSIPVWTGTKILVVGSNRIQRLVEFGTARYQFCSCYGTSREQRWKRKRATTSWIGDFNAIAVWIDATTATRNDEPPPPPGMTSRRRLDFNSAGTGNDEPLPPGVSGSTSASPWCREEILHLRPQVPGRTPPLASRRSRDSFSSASRCRDSTPPGSMSPRRQDR
ncbi:hypothetical protein OsJ_01613 [Oryza sativa Japonica Group]|uniref:Uncharacterized protein n=1 Tax=Oryza sativa subsp. japonica TaxID=39947 RepID=B9EW87_ORYSJ|nr:hypothetical protein OsJ_01613 [Oryza sativa Japonica Group]